MFTKESEKMNDIPFCVRTRKWVSPIYTGKDSRDQLLSHFLILSKTFGFLVLRLLIIPLVPELAVLLAMLTLTRFVRLQQGHKK